MDLGSVSIFCSLPGSMVVQFQHWILSETTSGTCSYTVHLMSLPVDTCSCVSLRIFLKFTQCSTLAVTRSTMASCAHLLCGLAAGSCWCADTSMWARIALSLSVAGTYVFIAVCGPICALLWVGGKRALVAATATWARIVLSLSSFGAFVFIAECDPICAGSTRWWAVSSTAMIALSLYVVWCFRVHCRIGPPQRPAGALPVWLAGSACWCVDTSLRARFALRSPRFGAVVSAACDLISALVKDSWGSCDTTHSGV